MAAYHDSCIEDSILHTYLLESGGLLACCLIPSSSAIICQSYCTCEAGDFKSFIAQVVCCTPYREVHTLHVDASICGQIISIQGDVAMHRQNC